MRVLLVGQAPGRTSDASLAFRGASGCRLARLIGISLPELPEYVDTVNLLPAWPGRSTRGKGDRFPVEVAREAAERLLRIDEHRVLLLAGRGVAAAFGVDPRVPWFSWVAMAGRRAAVIPHPSGTSHWLNEPARRAQVRRFLRRTLGLAG